MNSVSVTHGQSGGVRSYLSLCQVTELLYRPNRFWASKDASDGDGALSVCHTAEYDAQEHFAS